MSVISINYLLEAGVHFGHPTKRWNPKMKEYIFTSRDDIYIIDLQKTAKMIDEAYKAFHTIVENGGKVLYVGTKKQASDVVKEEAIRSNSYYVNTRWLGGTLTNFKTIRSRIKRLEEIENMEKDGTFKLLPKKEVIGLKKEYDKLITLLAGIRDMNHLPDALFIVDPSKEEIAIREARALKIPIFGIVDTNCDPDMVDYVIPGNDDAIRAVKLIISVMNNAIVEVNGGEIIDYSDNKKSDNANDIMQKALENVNNKENRNQVTQRNDRDSKRDNKFRRPERVESKEEKVEKTEPKVQKEVAKTETVKKATEDLSSMTVSELRDLAKAKEIKGYSTMKKAELLDALK